MKKEWHGSTDPADETGTATFQVLADSPTVTIPLASFLDFHALCAIVSDAERKGGKDMAVKLRSAALRFAETL
jgi:hypothetical protein